MKKQVFVLEIINNQRSTWQGVLRCIGGKKDLWQEERPFRSTLEMLHLINSVIEEDSPQQSDGLPAEEDIEMQSDQE